MIGADLDLSGWKKGLDLLSDEKLTSLARSMAVAGGQVLRDEAKRQVPVKTGLLQSSIYLAYKDGKSDDNRVVYSVSWNSRTAPHGHLIEFGTYKMAAKPFLRPAYDIAKGFAAKAMIERGRVRLRELLEGGDES